MDTTFTTIFYSFIAGFSTIIGIYIIRIKKIHGKKYVSILMPFAAGIILSVAFFHLIPEALELNKNSIYFVMAGFLTFYLLESALLVHAGPELHHIEHSGETKMYVSAQVAFIGLFLHSLIDGLIIGIGFEIDQSIGFLATFSIIMHELSEGITTYAILILNDSESKALKKSFLVAFATPIGALLSLLFINKISDPVIGLLLAFASGTFIYIAASDLIPETHNHKGKKNFIFLLLGVAIIFIASHL